MDKKKIFKSYRRKEKTNYKKRLSLLKSEKVRLVVRISNKNIYAQFVEYVPTGDKILFASSSHEIEKKGWKSIVGFQTRNIPHRAHEFLQKIGLSLTDGLLIHPIIGWKKKGDFNPEMIIKAYQILIDHYYPQDRVIFSGLATSMRYAGPLEAVFHAIIRKNFGCTHFIVGRDHAGVGGFYDKYEAHRIFDKFPDLGIIPLLLNGPYYCKKCLSVVSDKICPHHDTHNIEISGTSIRKMILQGERIGEEYLRLEVAEFILKIRNKCSI